MEANHDRASEVVVGFHRKTSGLTSMTWPEAVGQALCFGWIDGIRHGIDTSSYSNRFTPRKPRSNWSHVNITRVAELTRLGLMRPAGLDAFAWRTESRSRVYSYESPPHSFEGAQEAEFRSHPPAWEFFSSQPAGYRKLATFWVMSAKREETRERRLRTLIEHSQVGERLPSAAGPATGRS